MPKYYDFMPRPPMSERVAELTGAQLINLGRPVCGAWVAELYWGQVERPYVSLLTHGTADSAPHPLEPNADPAI